jgi:hypothetical protein
MLETWLRRIVALLTALAAIGAAVPASAQAWTTSFGPGDATLPSEAYVQAREAVAWAAEAPGYSRLIIQPYEDAAEAGSGIGPERALAMELELVRLGMSDGYIRIQPALVGADRRLVVTADRSAQSRAPGGYIDEMLVYFAPGSVEIPVAAQYRLQIYVARPHFGARRLEIIGRADTVGTAEANQRLSEHRAEAVARFLAAHGVSWEDIDIVGKGETWLSRATADGVSDPLNRLVSVDSREVPPPR